MSDGDQVKTFFLDLKILSARVLVAEAGSRRGSFNARPLKRLVETLLRDFVQQAPLVQLYRVALVVDVGLHDASYPSTVRGLLQALLGELGLACKDADGLAVAVRTFVTPLLLTT